MGLFVSEGKKIHQKNRILRFEDFTPSSQNHGSAENGCISNIMIGGMKSFIGGMKSFTGNHCDPNCSDHFVSKIVMQTATLC